MVEIEGPTATRKTKGRRIMVVADPTRESAGALQYALSHAILEKDELILIHVVSPCPTKGAFGLHSLSSIFRKQIETSSNNSESPTKGGGGGGGGVSGGGLFGNGGVGIFGGGVGIFGLNGVVEGNGTADFLKVMKKACHKARPKMDVRVEKVEQGCMDKATTVLSQTKLLAIDLLIIGQRRNLPYIFLGAKRNGGPFLGASKVLDTAEFLIENSMCTCVGVQKKSQNAGYLLNTRSHKNFWLLA
ncbi:unnamed protein product [Amaranthus hypochondriacus]